MSFLAAVNKLRRLVPVFFKSCWLVSLLCSESLDFFPQILEYLTWKVFKGKYWEFSIPTGGQICGWTGMAFWSPGRFLWDLIGILSPLTFFLPSLDQAAFEKSDTLHIWLSAVNGLCLWFVKIKKKKKKVWSCRRSNLLLSNRLLAYYFMQISVKDNKSHLIHVHSS